MKNAELLVKMSFFNDYVKQKFELHLLILAVFGQDFKSEKILSLDYKQFGIDFVSQSWDNTIRRMERVLGRSLSSEKKCEKAFFVDFTEEFL